MSTGRSVPPGSGAPGGVPDDIEEADPGLAKERTDLAWTRSSISFAALGIAIIKLRPAAGVPILVFSAVVWSLGHMPRTPDRARTASRRVRLVTIAITTLALAALVISLLSHGQTGLNLT